MTPTMTSGRTTRQSDKNRTEVRPKPDGRRTKARQNMLRIMFPLNSVAMAMALAMLQQRWRCSSQRYCCYSVANPTTLLVLHVATLLLQHCCCSALRRCWCRGKLLQRWRCGTASCCNDGGVAATLLLQRIAAVVLQSVVAVLQRCCCSALRHCWCNALRRCCCNALCHCCCRAAAAAALQVRR